MADLLVLTSLISIQNGKLEVDEYEKTNVDHIWAVGDVLEVLH